MIDAANSVHVLCCSVCSVVVVAWAIVPQNTPRDWRRQPNTMREKTICMQSLHLSGSYTSSLHHPAVQYDSFSAYDMTAV